jgi:hypothetical protein
MSHSRCPYPSGVYVVVREATGAPRFLERSEAGSWKGKNADVPVERLKVEWVTGVQTLSIGDAASLRERLGELVKFSRARGEPVRHWGGRLLWQLDGSQELQVAWKVEPYSAALEHDLLEEFNRHVRPVAARQPQARQPERSPSASLSHAPCHDLPIRSGYALSGALELLLC